MNWEIKLVDEKYVVFLLNGIEFKRLAVNHEKYSENLKATVKDIRDIGGQIDDRAQLLTSIPEDDTLID